MILLAAGKQFSTCDAGRIKFCILYSVCILSLEKKIVCDSWLLADPNMKVRSNYQGYQDAISRFFGDLLPRVADLQVGALVGSLLKLTGTSQSGGFLA